MYKNTFSRPLTRRQGGFTLIEVLVAFLILLVGLLGMAGLQLNGVKNTRESLFRSHATVLTADIIDRMRANLIGVDNNAYHNAVSGTITDDCLDVGGCTEAQMASTDIALWRAAVTNSLPTGDAIVCIDSTPDDGSSSGDPACDNAGDLSVAKLWWNDPDSSALQRYVTVFTP